MLLGGDGGEVDGVGWADGRLGKGAGHFDEDAAAGAVVGRSVIDVVALGVGIDTEMVVVCGVEDSVVRRARSGNAAYDVGTDVAADAAFNMALKADGKFNGMERAGLAGCAGSTGR